MDDSQHLFGVRHGEDSWESAYPFSAHHAALSYTAFGVNPNMLNGYHNHSSHHHAYAHAYHQNHSALPYTDDVKPQHYYIDSRTGQSYPTFTSPTSSRAAHAHYAALTAYNEQVYASRRKEQRAAAQAAEEEALYNAAFQEMVCLPDDDEDEVTEGNAGLSEGASSTTVENSPKSVLDHEEDAQGLRAVSTLPGEGVDRADLGGLSSASKDPLSAAQSLSSSAVTAPTAPGSDSGNALAPIDAHWRPPTEKVLQHTQGLPTPATTPAATSVFGDVTLVEASMPVPSSPRPAQDQGEPSTVVATTDGVSGSLAVPPLSEEQSRREDDEASEPTSSHQDDDNEQHASSIASSVKEEPITPIIVDQSLPLVIDLRNSNATPPNPSSSKNAAPEPQEVLATRSGERSMTPAPSPTRSAAAHSLAIVPPQGLPQAPLPRLDIPPSAESNSQDRSTTPEPSTTRVERAPTPPLPQGLPTVVPSPSQQRSLTPEPSTVRASLALTPPLPQDLPSPSRTRTSKGRSRTPSWSPVKTYMTRRASAASSRSVGERAPTYSSSEDSETSRLAMLAEIALEHLSPTERRLPSEVDMNKGAATTADDSRGSVTVVGAEPSLADATAIDTSWPLKIVVPETSVVEVQQIADVRSPSRRLAKAAPVVPAPSSPTPSSPLTPLEDDEDVPPFPEPMPTSEAAIENDLLMPQSSPFPSSQKSSRSFRAVFADMPSSSPITARAAYFSDEESNGEDAPASESDDEVSLPPTPTMSRTDFMASLMERATPEVEEVAMPVAEALSSPPEPAPRSEDVTILAEDAIAEAPVEVAAGYIGAPEAEEERPSPPPEDAPLSGEPTVPEEATTEPVEEVVAALETEEEGRESPSRDLSPAEPVTGLGEHPVAAAEEGRDSRVTEAQEDTVLSSPLPAMSSSEDVPSPPEEVEDGLTTDNSPIPQSEGMAVSSVIEELPPLEEAFSPAPEAESSAIEEVFPEVQGAEEVENGEGEAVEEAVEAAAEETQGAQEGAADGGTEDVAVDMPEQAAEQAAEEAPQETGDVDLADEEAAPVDMDFSESAEALPVETFAAPPAKLVPYAPLEQASRVLTSSEPSFAPEPAASAPEAALPPRKVARMVLDYIEVPPVPAAHRRAAARREPRAGPSTKPIRPKAPTIPILKIFPPPRSPKSVRPRPASPDPFRVFSPMASDAQPKSRILKRPHTSSSPVEAPRPKKRVRLASPPQDSPASSPLSHMHTRVSEVKENESPSTDNSPTSRLGRGPRTTNKLLPRPPRMRLGQRSDRFSSPLAAPPSTSLTVPQPVPPPPPRLARSPLERILSAEYKRPSTSYPAPEYPPIRPSKSDMALYRPEAASYRSETASYRSGIAPPKSALARPKSAIAPSKPEKRRRSPSPTKATPLPPKRLRFHGEEDEVRFPTATETFRTRNTLLPRPSKSVPVKQEPEPIVIPPTLANGVIDLVSDESEDELGRWDDVGLSFVVTKPPSVSPPDPSTSRRDERMQPPSKGKSASVSRDDAKRAAKRVLVSEEEEVRRREPTPPRPPRDPEARRPRRGWVHKVSSGPRHGHKIFTPSRELRSSSMRRKLRSATR